MWNSYHIYAKDYPLFLEELNSFKQCFVDSELFFVKYLDPIGMHFRLRIRAATLKTSKIDAIVYKHFNKYQVLKKIYDPEYNIFQEKLDVYELYSVDLTEFLVNQSSSVIFANYVVELVEKLLDKFRCNKADFIKSYMSYWSGYLKFYSEAETVLLKQQLNKGNLPNKLGGVLSILDQFAKNSRREELAFKYLHMTLNKMNFSIIDELVILENCLSKKLQV